MTVVTFASSKGGAGKTTSAIVLATTLAKETKVVAIDADPAQRFMSWVKKQTLPPRLHAFPSRGEHNIHDEIERAKQQADYVILDLEGAATRLNAFAMGESDLVIIPMGDEQPDAEGAIETFAQIQLESRSLRRHIPARVLFCRTQAAVKSRLARSLNAQVREKVGSFETELHTRTAFSSLHNSGGDLYHLDPNEVSGINKAIANAELFAEELKTLMKSLSEMEVSHDV